MLQVHNHQNIDRWVWGFLAGSRVSRGNRLFGRNGLEFKTAMGREDGLWRRAMNKRPTTSGLSEDFYWEEWSHVIQAQEVMEMEPGLTVRRKPSAEAMSRSLKNYRRVQRRERGTALQVSTRNPIFPIFETYWRELWRNRRIEWSTAYRVATEELKRASDGPGYASVVVDEAQDLGYQALRMIRAMVPKGKNDLMIVGDGHAAALFGTESRHEAMRYQGSRATVGQACDLLPHFRGHSALGRKHHGRPAHLRP